MTVPNHPSDHPAYTPMGDSINLASRMETESGRHGVPTVISEFTQARLDDEFQVEEIGEVDTKARPEPVRIYSLVSTAR